MKSVSGYSIAFLHNVGITCDFDKSNSQGDP